MFRLWLALLAFAIGGCANYAPRVGATERPGANDAYLYGRFSIDTPKAWLGIDGYTTMGFAVQCRDGQRYVIRFDKDQPLQAVKIKPSTCSWVETVYSDADGRVKGRKPAPAGANKSVTIEPNRAYYLGDFHAAFSSQGCGYRTACLNWKIDMAKDDFVSASTELDQSIPTMVALVKERAPLFLAP